MFKMFQRKHKVVNEEDNRQKYIQMVEGIKEELSSFENMLMLDTSGHIYVYQGDFEDYKDETDLSFPKIILLHSSCEEGFVRIRLYNFDRNTYRLFHEERIRYLRMKKGLAYFNLQIINEQEENGSSSGKVSELQNS